MFAPPVDRIVRNPIFPFASSPLSPRSPNAQPLFMSHPSKDPHSSPSQPSFSFQAQETSPFQRARTDPRSSRATPGRVGTPPLNATRSSEARRHHRRDQFLGSVRQRQDDKRWEARGDQILHQDFIRRQREWESAKARSAPDIWIDPEEAETADTQWATEELDSLARTTGATSNLDGHPVSLQQQGEGSHNQQPSEAPSAPPEPQPTEAEIDALLSAEAEELEAMVRLHEQQRATHSSSPIYAEDEEFEDALLGVSVLEDGAGEDAMDMS